MNYICTTSEEEFSHGHEGLPGVFSGWGYWSIDNASGRIPWCHSNQGAVQPATCHVSFSSVQRCMIPHTVPSALIGQKLETLEVTMGKEKAYRILISCRRTTPEHRE